MRARAVRSHGSWPAAEGTVKIPGAGRRLGRESLADARGYWIPPKSTSSFPPRWPGAKIPALPISIPVDLASSARRFRSRSCGRGELRFPTICTPPLGSRRGGMLRGLGE
jgi:hypothetical protein